jgi:predicted ribonuclease YlaK
MNKRYALDTNLFLRFPNIVELLDGYSLSVPSMILRELEKFETLKYRYGAELAYESREIRRGLNKLKREQKIYVDLKDYKWDLNDHYSPDYMDNCILKYCLVSGDGLITYDGLLKEKAEQLGIEVLDIEEKIQVPEEKYSGYKQVKMNEEMVKSIYNGELKGNPYGLLTNQYLVANDDNGLPLDAFRFDGEHYLSLIGKKSLKTKLFGEFKPLDIYQKLALDSLANNKLNMITGSAGTGKTLIALNYEMQQLENGKIDKIIFFVNPFATKNSVQLGFYTGSVTEKLLQTSVGNMLKSKFGDSMIIESMIARQEILLLPFADIRGFDTTGMRACVHILEAQNLDKELMKLAVQRIGEDSKLIIDGDHHTQVDSRAYEGINNGMRRVSEVFRGIEYFGQVELPNIYRSEMAKRAELM